MKDFFKYLVAICMVVGAMSLQAQSFGVRAGLNYNTFNGPQENAGESYGIGGGFHFGINYSYHVSDLFSLVFEIGYTQNGTSYKYNGDSYFIIREDDYTVYEPGTREMELTISNGYIMLPVVANYKLSKKFEVFGGAYANLLVSPTGSGKFYFKTSNTIVDGIDHIEFEQSLDYSYGSDEALEGYTPSGDVENGVYIDGNEVYFAQVAGAYYQHAEKKANLINSLDAGLVGGLNYFINRGFYAGVRFEYGLLDITDKRADAAISELDENNQLIYRDDKDTHMGVNVSIGFRF